MAVVSKSGQVQSTVRPRELGTQGLGLTNDHQVGLQRGEAANEPLPVAEARQRGDLRTSKERGAEEQLTGAGAQPGASHGARRSSMLALRVASGQLAPLTRAEKIEAARAEKTKGAVVLEAILLDPATGRAPTIDQVAADMLALLRKGLGAPGREVLDKVAREPIEAYYVISYDDRSGKLALTRVATGDDRHVRVGLEQIRAVLKDGETLLGGLHNHPGRLVARASHADVAANEVMQPIGGGGRYEDLIVARGKKSGPSLTTVPRGGVRDGGAAFQDAIVEYQSFFKKSDKHDRGVRGGHISDGPTNEVGERLLQNAIDQGGDSKRKLAVDGDRFVVFDETNGMTGEFHGHYRDWDELNDRQKSALIKAGLVDRKGRVK